MKISYPFLWKLLIRVVFAALTGRTLSFREEAAACIRKLNPMPEVHGIEYLPEQGGYVVLVNHYYRPWFHAWWITLAVSAVVPHEIHWIMAAAWTYPGKPYGTFLEKISRLLFRKAADVFTFTTMPPMPPRPFEVLERAQAVRKVLKLVHKYPNTILGLAPEGGDNPDGKIHLPPPGAGRFIHHLAESGLKLVPAGIYETDRLCLRFGAPIQLVSHKDKSSADLDQQYSMQVFTAIAALLPVKNVSNPPV